MAWITERPKSRTFLVRWRDTDGKTKSHSVTWGRGPEPITREEARAEAESWAYRMQATERRNARAFKTAEKSGELLGFPPIAGRRDAEYQFANYLRAMIDSDKALRATTRELYLRNLRVHVEGTVLAETDIRDITPELLDAFWTRLNAGVGAQRNVQQLLSKGLRRAVRKGIIDVNPLERSDVKRPPTGRTVEVRPLSVDEVERLADSAKYPRDRLEILVMAYGGLRAGEVGGLRAQDITRAGDRCQLKLRQQAVRVTGKPKYVSPLKTKAALRTVSIPCSVADELKAFVKAEPPASDGRVFHGPNGAMRAHNAITHGVKTAAKRAGFDDRETVFAHRLRHTAVSFWIEDGANPKEVQRMVGHANIRETLQTYSHLFDYGGSEMAESMEKRRQAYRSGA